jgi:uncharacterized protein YwgA
MNLTEAIKTNQYVKRKDWDNTSFCHYLPNTGPYKSLVDCDYFCFIEDGFISFSTTGPDLYAEEIMAQDYEMANITEADVLEAYRKTENLK